jgi:hypothetical protein
MTQEPIVMNPHYARISSSPSLKDLKFPVGKAEIIQFILENRP